MQDVVLDWRCFGEAFDDEASYLAAQPDDAYLGELLGEREPEVLHFDIPVE